MLEPIWIVGVTGHRPNPNADAEPGRSIHELEGCHDQIKEVLETLQGQAEAECGRIELLSSVAAGADLEAVKAAEELGVRVHIILPKPEAFFAADFEGPLGEQWSRAKQFIERARDNRDGWSLRLSAAALEDWARDCQADDERKSADSDSSYYRACNFEMLRIVDALVAVLSDQEHRTGGTAEVVTEAKRLSPGEVGRNRCGPGEDESMDKGIPTVQIDPTGNHRVDWSIEFSDWPPQDDLLGRLNKKDADRNPPQPPRSSGDRGGEGPGWDQFTCLDDAAKDAGRGFRRPLVVSIVLHFIATLIAAAAASFTAIFHDRAASHSGWAVMYEWLPIVLITIEMLLLGAAVALVYWARRKQSHEEWIECRFGAEAAHGMLMSAPLLDPLQPQIASLKPEWRRFGLSMALTAHHNAARGTDAASSAQDFAIEYRKNRVEQQKAYFEREWNKAQSRHTALGRLTRGTTVGALALVLVALGLKWFVPEEVATEFWAAGLALFLPLLMPLLAGAVTSLRLAIDAGRRAVRYRELAARLAQIGSRMEGAQTWGTLRRLVSATEELLLDELVGWHGAARHIHE